MKKESNTNVFLLFIRYFSLIVIWFIFNSSIIYNIFLNLTIRPVNILLSFFYDSIIIGNSIIINSTLIEIIPACVAISAYFLLFILNFTTSMPARTRVKSILFSFSILLIINILRIFILSILFLNKYAYYDIVHKTFWYLLSILIVIGIWFYSVYLFKIKNIPIYSDFKSLIKDIKFKTSKKH